MRALGVVTIVLVAFTAGCRFDVNGVSGSPCATDDDCGPDQVCYRTYCVQRECQAPADCGTGHQFQCTDGLCHAVTCDEGCGAGYACDLAGLCTASGCVTDDDCDDHKPCNGPERCAGGQC